MGVSINGGTPRAGWSLMDNAMKMDDVGVPWGTPIDGKPPYAHVSKNTQAPEVILVHHVVTYPRKNVFCCVGNALFLGFRVAQVAKFSRPLRWATVPMIFRCSTRQVLGEEPLGAMSL